ncbi:MAG: FAD:protein FMN transferase [Pseudomonadota bacterium]
MLRISGDTMGTTYNITAVDVPDQMTEDVLTEDIEAVLAAVNAKMSNWDKESEVSRFSASADTSPFKLSDDFVTVMIAADEVHAKSGGKFDVTLGPLIELWGFGPRKPEDPIPSDDEIERALGYVGQQEVLKLNTVASTISKSASEVGINLSAIAKGFGIDAVAEELKELGVENYMVEIGGDLVVSGRNDKGEFWRIGIEKPEPDESAVEQVIKLENKGLATSGDYRNFVEFEGVRYSHIIDPVTGRPITHWTTSATVVADNAMMADAWATAMLVIGSEKGLEIAEANQIAVFFISRVGQEGSDPYITAVSSAYQALLDER